MAKIIAVWNNKGGVAKTTLSFHLAQGLALTGHYVLLIDNDPQLCLSSVYCGVKPELPGMAQIFSGKMQLKECIIPQKEIQTNKENTLGVVPGNALFSEAMSMENLPKLNIANFIQGIRDPDVHAVFDYIIIDNPPPFEGTTKVMLEVADEIIIPCVPDKISMIGLMNSFALITRMGPQYLAKVKKVIPTIVKPTSHSKNQLVVMKSLFNERVTENIVVSTATVQNALDQRKVVYLYEYTSEYAQSMLRLMTEIFPEIAVEDAKTKILSIRDEKRIQTLMDNVRRRKEASLKLKAIQDHAGTEDEIESAETKAAMRVEA